MKSISIRKIFVVVVVAIAILAHAGQAFAGQFGNATGSNLQSVRQADGIVRHLLTITTDDGLQATVRVGLFMAVDSSVYQMELNGRLNLVEKPFKRCSFLGCTKVNGKVIAQSGQEYTIGVNDAD